MMKISLSSLLFLLFSFHTTAINKPVNQSVGYTENKGQIIDQNNKPNPIVKYLYNGSGLNVQLRANGFSYDTYTIERKPKAKTEIELNFPEKFEAAEEDIIYHYHRIDIEFIGANAEPTIVADQANTGYTNYYTSGTDEAGVTFVKTYQHVTYENLYTGIDLEFEIDKNSKPKYNFIIHPGADANQIKWQYIGANKTSLENNKIILGIAQGNLEEKIPLSYIIESGAKLMVNYQQEEENTFSFQTNQYDQTKTLIIDPIPWATYHGGLSCHDFATGVVTDTVGNVYMCGRTRASINIATVGTHQTTPGGGLSDAFVTKFNSNGVRLWGSYYGGSGDEEAYGIKVNKLGETIYVCGSTWSTSNPIHIATTGSHQPLPGGLGDAFLAKFNALGMRQWGTYYGGTRDETAWSVTEDLAENVYMVGITDNIHFNNSYIATGGAHQATFGGNYDGFIVKFNALGIRQWGTYYGGSGSEGFRGVAIDLTGAVYACGFTSSTNNIATIGAHQPAFWGGNYDAFMVKFNTSGIRQWGTYYGGINQDEANGINLDKNGNIYLCGYTESTINIATTGTHMSTLMGGGDGYIAKFDSSGARIWGTYYGGTAFDCIYGIALNDKGNITVCGRTLSSSNIASVGAFQTTYSGGGDAFLARFNGAVGSIMWSTYFGQGGQESFRGVAVADLVYTAGGVTPPSFSLATVGAHQTILDSGSTSYSFLAAFSRDLNLPVKLLSFTGKKDGEGVVLVWQTASEVNNAKFEIERSNNNTDWTNIGNVKGNGTTNLTSRYRFVDNSLSVAKQEPSLYYRLKQIDFDGAYEYSKTILIQDNKDLEEGIISPNPFSNNLSIELNSLNAGLGKLKIVDAMGKEYYHSIETITEGLNQININTNSFVKGLYIVQLQINGQLVSRKVLKQ